MNNVKLKEFFRKVYFKLVKINDTPQKIALGLGLGVFAGVLPGTGPLVALFLALVFRVNKAAAFLGSLVTNTWFSIVTFLLAIKIGSAIFKISWQNVYSECLVLLRDFHFQNLFSLSILKLIFPVATGYLIISFASGLVVYLAALIIIKARLRSKS